MRWQNCRHKTVYEEVQNSEGFFCGVFYSVQYYIILCEHIRKLQKNTHLWTMGKSLGVYPHGKRGKHGFSTRLFTLSTVVHREICGQKENKCLFCGNLKMPKIRHSSFGEKMSCLDKLSYGNRFLKISQTFLWVLTAKKV